MTVVTSPPPSIVDAYPLAALQAGMLYHSRLAEGARTYHDVLTVKLAGEFDEPALRASLAELVRRHAVLRTGFDLTGYSEPLQVVYAGVEPELTVTDLSHLPAEAASARLADWAGQEQRRGFDWSRPPLLRARVHRLEAQLFALTLSFHHAILDGWSVATLLTELVRRYAGHLDGSPLAADEPEASYRDFVAAEIAARDSDRAREFWRGVLRDAPLTRIAREPASATHPAGVASHDTVIDAQLAARVAGVAAELRVPLRTVLLAVHLRVMALLTGDHDVLSGLLSNGRPESDASAEVLGLFLNIVAMRLRLRRESWASLIGRVYQAETALLPNRLYPLFELQRLADRSPLFDVVFDYRDFRAYRDLPDERRIRIVERRHLESTDVPLAVTFVRNQRDGQLHLYLNYQRAEFTAGQVDRIHRHYLHALAHLAAGPDASAVATAPYLAGGASVVTGERVDFGPPTTLTELFLARVADNPDGDAVVDGQCRLSYRELAARADAVAARLRGLGIGPESVVGVHVPRSADFAVAVLGVLLAGAAVVPLEVDYPLERLRQSMSDSAAAALLTTRALRDRLDYLGPVELVDAPQPPDPAATVVPTPVSPDGLAYLLYTSGSTGRPKGVALSHAALANYARWAIRSLGLGPADRVAQRSPAGFDAALYELLVAWLSGAAAVIVPSDVAANPTRLAERITSAGVTYLLMVPSLLALHVEAGTWSRCPTLRLVACAGEALPQALVDGFAAQSPARLVNLYGPTEGGIGAAERWAHPGEPAHTVPIGRASGNVRLYVLDEFDQVQPTGAPGELHIGGIQLARGYAGAPRLTAERFRPNQLSGRLGERWYRTGDRVRLLPGGDLEFLGRLDDQLKVNGVRVELAEIQAVLHQHPAVRQAAVAVRETGDGRQGIVAYVVLRSTLSTVDGELRRFLRERLHEAMLPNRYLTVDRIPVLPNGKLDRAALPEPAVAAPENAGVGPRDQVEARLVELWQDVLGVAAIGVHDDFFVLGGHSLLALRLVMRIGATFGRELPIAALMSAPTVAGLAELLRGPEDLVPKARIVPMGGTGTRWPVFLMHGLGGQVFRFQPLARRLRPDGPVYALPARGFADGERPHATLPEMAREYAELIRGVDPDGPYVVGGFCIGGNIALEVARELRRSGGDVRLVAMFWSNAHQPVLAESLEDETTLMMHALAGGQLDIDRARLRGLPADEQLLAVIEAAAETRRLTPAASDLNQARRVLDVYRSNAHAVGRHRHEPYDGPVALFMPEDDPALAGIGSGGWESVVRGRFDLLAIPGTRSTSVREPLVARTARCLTELLERGME
jgi:amino acid adenylation domain-containing protein